MSEDTPDESVRRLLADARHTGPLPPEVAARLDVLLGELVDARSAESGVSSLAARRSRRRGLLLVAAAAAAVFAIAVPTITRSGADRAPSTASDTAGSAAGGSAEPRSGLAQAPSPESSSSLADQAVPAPGVPAPGVPAPGAPIPTLALTSSGFDAEVRGALLGSAGGGGAYDSFLSLLPDSCPRPATTYPFLFFATYDARPAVLGATAPVDGSQQAVLYLCGRPDPVRSVTVEVPR